MHRIDRLMSPFKPESELSLVNREAARAAVPIGAEMFGLIERSLEFSRLSDGAFDITYAGVGHLYDYRQGIAPDAAAIQQARQAVGWQHLVLDAQARTIRFAREGVRIDLGGFAKGHVVDNSIKILKHMGIAHAVVAAGGDSHVRATVAAEHFDPGAIGTCEPSGRDARRCRTPRFRLRATTSATSSATACAITT
jgi:thiamine biosynthesis lipoprotein